MQKQPAIYIATILSPTDAAHPLDWCALVGLTPVSTVYVTVVLTCLELSAYES